MYYATSYCCKTHNGSTINFTGPCATCKKEQSVDVNRVEYENYERGALIQNALVSNNSDDREFLISGICPTCWQNLFCDNDE